MIRKLSLLVAAGATAVALVAAPASADVTKLKMMYTIVSGFAGGYLAQDAGLFAKHNVDVDFEGTNNSANNAPALESNSVQIAGPTLVSVLQANDGGLDLVVIAGGAVYPLEADVLVARKDSGITKPADLAGKTVGVPGLGALLHVMLVRDLKNNKVDPKSVKFVTVGFAQATEALKSGQIDAYPSQAPFTARILQSGAGYAVANWLKDTPDGTLTVVYTATRKWAEANKDVVKSFRDGLKDAEQLAAKDKDAVYKAISHYTKLPLPVVSSLSLPNLKTQIEPQQIKFWSDIALEQGLIKKPVDPDKLLFQP
jgi:NitT/TauT family transport system substrate-binding protein